MRKFISVVIFFMILCYVGITHSKVVGENSYNLCLDECCRNLVDGKLEQLENLEQTLRARGLSESRIKTYRREWVKFNSRRTKNCLNDIECAECLDMCREELEKNSPSIAKKLDDIEIVRKTPTDCFIEAASSEE